MRNCPLCDGKGAGPAFPYATKWNGTEFHYIECGVCAATYVDPPPSEADLALLYAKENYHDQHYRTLELNAARASVSWLRSLCPQARTLLDFGCGTGAFLVAAREAGFDCIGVEYEEAARENAGRIAGVPVRSLAELEASGVRFDVVHLGDVLEHLIRPAELMKQLRGHLGSGGVFFVEGPLQRNASLVYWCAAGLKRLRRVLGIDRLATAPPTHILLTDRISQFDFFVQRLGYSPLRYELHETGWPYLAGGEPVRSAATFIRQFIGRSSIVLSWLTRRSVMGNRFRGAFRPSRQGR